MKSKIVLKRQLLQRQIFQKKQKSRSKKVSCSYTPASCLPDRNRILVPVRPSWCQLCSLICSYGLQQYGVLARFVDFSRRFSIYPALVLRRHKYGRETNRKVKLLPETKGECQNVNLKVFDIFDYILTPHFGEKLIPVSFDKNFHVKGTHIYNLSKSRKVYNSFDLGAKTCAKNSFTSKNRMVISSKRGILMSHSRGVNHVVESGESSKQDDLCDESPEKKQPETENENQNEDTIKSKEFAKKKFEELYRIVESNDKQGGFQPMKPKDNATEECLLKNSQESTSEESKKHQELYRIVESNDKQEGFQPKKPKDNSTEECVFKNSQESRSEKSEKQQEVCEVENLQKTIDSLLTSFGKTHSDVKSKAKGDCLTDISKIMSEIQNQSQKGDSGSRIGFKSKKPDEKTKLKETKNEFEKTFQIHFGEICNGPKPKTNDKNEFNKSPSTKIVKKVVDDVKSNFGDICKDVKPKEPEKENKTLMTQYKPQDCQLIVPTKSSLPQQQNSGKESNQEAAKVSPIPSFGNLLEEFCQNASSSGQKSELKKHSGLINNAFGSKIKSEAGNQTSTSKNKCNIANKIDRLDHMDTNECELVIQNASINQNGSGKFKAVESHVKTVCPTQSMKNQSSGTVSTSNQLKGDCHATNSNIQSQVRKIYSEGFRYDQHFISNILEHQGCELNNIHPEARKQSTEALVKSRMKNTFLTSTMNNHACQRIESNKREAQNCGETAFPKHSELNYLDARECEMILSNNMQFEGKPQSTAACNSTKSQQKHNCLTYSSENQSSGICANRQTGKRSGGGCGGITSSIKQSESQNDCSSIQSKNPRQENVEIGVCEVVISDGKQKKNATCSAQNAHQKNDCQFNSFKKQAAGTCGNDQVSKKSSEGTKCLKQSQKESKKDCFLNQSTIKQKSENASYNYLDAGECELILHDIKNLGDMQQSRKTCSANNSQKKNTCFVDSSKNQLVGTCKQSQSKKQSGTTCTGSTNIGSMCTKQTQSQTDCIENQSNNKKSDQSKSISYLDARECELILSESQSSKHQSTSLCKISNSQRSNTCQEHSSKSQSAGTCMNSKKPQANRGCGEDTWAKQSKSQNVCSTIQSNSHQSKINANSNYLDVIECEFIVSDGKWLEEKQSPQLCSMNNSQQKKSCQTDSSKTTGFCQNVQSNKLIGVNYGGSACGKKSGNQNTCSAIHSNTHSKVQNSLLDHLEDQKCELISESKRNEVKMPIVVSCNMVHSQQKISSNTLFSEKNAETHCKNIQSLQQAKGETVVTASMKQNEMRIDCAPKGSKSLQNNSNRHLNFSEPKECELINSTTDEPPETQQTSNTSCRSSNLQPSSQTHQSYKQLDVVSCEEIASRLQKQSTMKGADSLKAELNKKPSSDCGINKSKNVSQKDCPLAESLKKIQEIFNKGKATDSVKIEKKSVDCGKQVGDKSSLNTSMNNKILSKSNDIGECELVNSNLQQKSKQKNTGSQEGISSVTQFIGTCLDQKSDRSQGVNKSESVSTICPIVESNKQMEDIFKTTDSSTVNLTNKQSDCTNHQTSRESISNDTKLKSNVEYKSRACDLQRLSSTESQSAGFCRSVDTTKQFQKESHTKEMDKPSDGDCPAVDIKTNTEGICHGSGLGLHSEDQKTEWKNFNENSLTEDQHCCELVAPSSDTATNIRERVSMWNDVLMNKDCQVDSNDRSKENIFNIPATDVNSKDVNESGSASAQFVSKNDILHDLQAISNGKQWQSVKKMVSSNKPTNDCKDLKPEDPNGSWSSKETRFVETSDPTPKDLSVGPNQSVGPKSQKELEGNCVEVKCEKQSGSVCLLVEWKK